MRVFVLCAGRCGSLAFAKACSHITNFTSGHETNWGKTTGHRFVYPDRHIEVDNRLVWHMRALRANNAEPMAFVHLERRDEQAWVRSLMQTKLLRAYGEMMGSARAYPYDLAASLIMESGSLARWAQERSVTRFHMYVEEYAERFPLFWDQIGALGNLDVALAEFKKGWNRTEVAA